MATPIVKQPSLQDATGSSRRSKLALLYPYWQMSVPPTNMSFAMDILGHIHAQGLSPHADVSFYNVIADSQAGAEEHEGVRYHNVPAKFDPLLRRALHLTRSLPGRRFSDPARPPFASSAYFLEYGCRTALQMRRDDCDIAHVFIYDQLVPFVRRFNPDARIVLHLHDHQQLQRDRDLLLGRLNQTDMIVGCSQFVTERVRERFPEVADRCRAIPNGGALDDDGPSAMTRDGASRIKLMFVGRLSPEKGVHILIDAFVRLHRQQPNVSLDLIGPDSVPGAAFVDPFEEDAGFDQVRSFLGPDQNYRGYLESLIPDDVRASVTFHGEVPHDDLIDHYRQADVFVFPSLWDEPFGLPVVEAMSLGIPVVVSRGGAFPEIVEDGKSGFVVARGESNALTEALSRLVIDGDLRRKMGLLARQRAREHFSWERYIADWVVAYDDLLRDER